ncbi:MAG: hypothetical protein JW751_15470 [Polyangiaceae bacterium]|nr:hypothetical protein [Polyangiaceae bacterium]
MSFTPRVSTASLLLLAAFGCHGNRPDGPGTASASSAESSGSAQVAGSARGAGSARAVSPASALGTVRGRVRIEGDPAPIREAILKKIPETCGSARDFYGPLFRRAADGGLADALVAVTGYRALPPARQPFETVVGEACRWDKRTIALTNEQKLGVGANDTFGYVPELVGANAPALMIPIPGGETVELSPPRSGRYALVDSAHGFIRADVFVLAYPTFDVTGIDGRYEIPNVPAGPVKVNALLPELMLTAESAVEVRTDKIAEVDLTLRFDAKTLTPAASAAPARPVGAASPPASSATPIGSVNPR